MKDKRLYAIILSFMSRIAAGDAALIEQVCSNHSDLVYKEGRLIFMISGLYRHLILENDALLNEFKALLEYRDFRRLLYNSDINTQLAKQGHTIAVLPLENRLGKVDANWYELKLLDN